MSFFSLLLLVTMGSLNEALLSKFILPENFPRYVITKKSRKSENLILKLRYREINGGCPYACTNPRIDPVMCSNQFYKNIVPNFTCEDIDKPNCYLRKFTFDGKYLIGFNYQMLGLVVYDYRGSTAAINLLQSVNYKNETINEYDINTEPIKKTLFDTILRLKSQIHLARNGHYLHKDFLLFLDDNRHAIVFSSKSVPEELISYYDIHRSNESLNLTQKLKSTLEDFTMYLVNFVDGKLVDQYTFKCDRINTIYQHGVFLYNRTLSVFSLQHQTIYIFHITPNCRFIKVREIGRFVHEDDNLLIGKVLSTNQNQASFREIQFTTLKHRLLAYLYKKAAFPTPEKNSFNLTLNDFYNNFDYYSSMKMWRLQLLDEEHILIKFESDDVLRIRLNPKSLNLYVVYNFITTEIVNAFPQNSEDLLHIFECFANWFKYPLISNPTVSNNYYAKKLHERFKQIAKDSRNGDWTEAVKYILQSLPFHCQIYSFSPYLDVSLFSYEDRIVNSTDKPRPSPEFPIRFHNRQTSRFAFRWHTQQERTPRSNRRVMLSFIHHPNDAFAISIVRTQYKYHVNFHIRHFNP